MPGGELLRGQVAEARMGTFAIVRDAPAFDLAASVVERKENVLVEAYMDPARAQGCKSAAENPVAAIYPAFNRSGVVRSGP